MNFILLVCIQSIPDAIGELLHAGGIGKYLQVAYE